MDLSKADETTLMIEWLKRVRTRRAQMLTRSGRTEVRHVLLYASQQLSELRTSMLRDEMTSSHTVLELHEVITSLEGLIAYLETGRGGFSALGDRNER
jgi:hypothetical protein